jgi:hypothetical protein
MRIQPANSTKARADHLHRTRGGSVGQQSLGFVEGVGVDQRRVGRVVVGAAEGDLSDVAWCPTQRTSVPMGLLRWC